MATVNNCNLPEDRSYHVDFNVWVKDRGDGTFALGMTDIAQAMAVLHCRGKKAGKAVKAGKSLATVESGKWVGPIKAPFALEIVEKNASVESTPAVINTSPYDDGWIAIVKPSDAAAAEGVLTSDPDKVKEGFEAYMAEKGFAGCEA